MIRKKIASSHKYHKYETFSMCTLAFDGTFLLRPFSTDERILVMRLGRAARKKKIETA